MREIIINTLEAIKERLEVREGSRGNPYERAVTLRDLEALGVGGTSLVFDDPDRETGGIKGHKVIHYQSYVAVLTKAIQELSERVRQLEHTT